MANDQKPVISVRKLRKVYMMGQEHVVALHNICLLYTSDAADEL